MIDVALSRDQLRPSGLAVVIDVLRATSTATQALAAGYRRVLLTDSLERARTLRAPGRVLAGERWCLTPPGFDVGNSPSGVLSPQGEELVLATTNGTPAALAAARQAPRVMLACLLNLEAVIEALTYPAAEGPDDVQLVCSGTDGGIAVEDVYVAGRLCAEIDGPRTDAALVAEAVARAYPTPFEALSASAHAAALGAAGLAEDIVHCAQESKLDVVPQLVASSRGVAVVAGDEAGAAPPGARMVDNGYTVST